MDKLVPFLFVVGGFTVLPFCTGGPFFTSARAFNPLAADAAVSNCTKCRRVSSELIFLSRE